MKVFFSDQGEESERDKTYPFYTVESENSDYLLYQGFIKRLDRHSYHQWEVFIENPFPGSGFQGGLTVPYKTYESAKNAIKAFFRDSTN